MTTENNTQARKQLPRVFGMITNMHFGRTKTGKEVVNVTFQCGKGENTFDKHVVIFAPKAIAQARTVGTGVMGWAVGEYKPTKVYDRETRASYSEDRMNVVAIGKNEPAKAKTEAPAAEAEAGEPTAETAAEPAAENLDDEIPF